MNVELKPIAESKVRRLGSAPECPYPCGWDKLLNVIVENAANFARSTLDDEIPESVRQMGIDSGQYAIHLCKLVMKLSTPATPQPEGDGWVKCSERLPEDGRWYLVAAMTDTPDGGERVTTIAFLDLDTRNNLPIWLAHNDSEPDEWECVTHWMPPPQPPQEGE